MVGDWNGDGTVTVGVVNPLGVFATWYLRSKKFITDDDYKVRFATKFTPDGGNLIQ